jgi:hypothetical protein
MQIHKKVEFNTRAEIVTVFFKKYPPLIKVVKRFHRFILLPISANWNRVIMLDLQRWEKKGKSRICRILDIKNIELFLKFFFR